jgi:pilus assembly protein TadC
MRRLGWAGLALVAVLVAVALLHPASAARGAAAGPLVLTVVSPGPNGTATSVTPTIVVDYSDTAGQLNPASVVMLVDGVNVSASGLVVIGSSSISYAVPSILKLPVGANNASITASDAAGHTASVAWNFTVTPAATVAPNPLSALKPTTILLYIGVAAAISGAIVGGYILFLKLTTRFTLRRYFATHAVERLYLTLYAPLGGAFVFTLVGLSYVFSNPGLPSNAVDFVFIGAVFIGLTAFGIDSRRQLARIRTFERAFAQFLFEMADAMRGGIDPAKALVELSKTHTNILARHLRVAADSVRLGRPFDAILREMVASMKSPLITRYAGLIADASTIGGETATVVYRAAKDMDDFVKIEEEREKQLALPVAVIYIAFAVLLAVLFSLLYIAPTLGTLNVSFLGLGSPLNGGGGGAAASVPKLTVPTMKERFFELMIINALGTGAIIGSFTEGKARYGLLHSLGLVAATAVAFLVLFP